MGSVVDNELGRSAMRESRANELHRFCVPCRHYERCSQLVGTFKVRSILINKGELHLLATQGDIGEQNNRRRDMDDGMWIGYSGL